MVTSRMASTRLANGLSRPAWSTIRANTSRRGWSQAQRRAYASSGEHGSSTHKASSDLPWAITSIVITVPATWYLIQPQIERYKKGKGGHGHHEHHLEISHVDEPEPAKDEPKAEEEAPSESSGDSKGNAEESKEGEEATDKDSGEEGLGEKPEEQSEGEEKEGEKEDAEEASSSDESGKEGQYLSGAKHPMNPATVPGRSTKGEGVAETAKLHGTVDPTRPAK